MHTGHRLLLGLVLAVALAACSSASGTTGAVAGQGSGGTPTTLPPTEPFPDVMTGGRYLFGPFGDRQSMIVATGPDGWVGVDPGWGMDGPEPVRTDAPTGIGIVFFTANGLYSDPCHWDVSGTMDAGVPGDVVVGPTVDDLVAALRANTFYTSTTPKPVTIDGYAGKELELQLPNRSFANCDKDDPTDPGGHELVFSGPGLQVKGPGNRWHLYILDVHGSRLIAVILSYAKTPKTDLDLARNVIETLDINP